MSDTTNDLKQKWQELEADAIRLQNEKDAAIDKIRAEYGDKQRDAVDKAAAAQKAYLDADAADALRDRPDGAAVAETLGLTL
jgi:malate synthase